MRLRDCDLLDLYERAAIHARNTRFKDLAYDFAGFMTIRWLEGKAQHQTIAQGFIDFLRTTFGDATLVRNKKYLAVRDLPLADERDEVESDNPWEYDRTLFKGGFIATQPDAAWNDWKKALTEDEQRVFDMSVFQDRTHEDIARTLGWCTRTVHVTMKIAKRKLARWIEQTKNEGSGICVVKVMEAPKPLPPPVRAHPWIIKGPDLSHVPVKREMNPSTRRMLERYKLRWGLGNEKGTSNGASASSLHGTSGR